MPVLPVLLPRMQENSVLKLFFCTRGSGGMLQGRERLLRAGEIAAAAEGAKRCPASTCAKKRPARARSRLIVVSIVVLLIKIIRFGMPGTAVLA